MMYEDDRNLEAGSSIDIESPAGLVRRVIGALDVMSANDFDVLLADLLCAAWPTPTAQAQ